VSRPSEPADVRELFDDERAEQRRRRAHAWAQTEAGRECIDSLRAEATGRASMTPERAAEREDETIEALIGLALLCAAWVALDALFRYLTTGG
jgi:hypothetical protein